MKKAKAASKARGKKKLPAKAQRSKPAEKGKRGQTKVESMGRGIRRQRQRAAAVAETTKIEKDEIPVDLGPIVLPEPEDAVRVLKELAELNDRTLAAHRSYIDKAKTAKVAKEKWEGLAEEVQSKIRIYTHASDLPLFDRQVREDDQKRMESAAKQPAAEAADTGAAPAANESATGTDGPKY